MAGLLVFSVVAALVVMSWAWREYDTAAAERRGLLEQAEIEASPAKAWRAALRVAAHTAAARAVIDRAAVLRGVSYNGGDGLTWVHPFYKWYSDAPAWGSDERRADEARDSAFEAARCADRLARFDEAAVAGATASDALAFARTRLASLYETHGGAEYSFDGSREALSDIFPRARRYGSVVPLEALNLADALALADACEKDAEAFFARLKQAIEARAAANAASAAAAHARQTRISAVIERLS